MRLPALAVPAAVLLVLAVGLSPTSLAAQGALDAQAPRMHAGVAIAIAQPTGEFKDYVSVGGGIHGYFRVDVDETGILSFRLQGGFGRGEITAWATYDFASNAFNTLVITFIFSRYFQSVVAPDEVTTAASGGPGR
jgi:hypothetical protein